MRTFAVVLSSMLFVARGLLAQCPDGSPPPCAQRSPGPPQRSVAILYFDNLSRDSSDALLADGFTEELIVRLGRIESLQVKSRGVVQRYRGQTPDPTAVGRQLNVAFVVSGTMRKSGDRVRISAELARASTGTQVWADVFDRGSTDLITIESDLGEAVAEAIAGRLRPGDQAVLRRRPTRNPAAWEAYLRGNALIARRLTGGLPGAIGAYREAVRLDPDFADAWGRLAEGLSLGSLGYLGTGTDTVLLRRQAREAAARALALDTLSAAAWIGLGIGLGFERRYLESVAAYARAVRLDSTLAEAEYHLGNTLRPWTDDQMSAERHLLRAHALDPSLLNAVEWLVVLHWKAGRTFEALGWFDTLSAMAPELVPGSHHSNLLITDFHLDLLLRAGDTTAARTELAQLLVGDLGVDSTGLQAIAARVFADLGDTVQARAHLRRALHSVDTHSAPLDLAGLLASGLAALGERDGALTVLESRQADGGELYDLMHNPYFESLRREPRFARLLESVRPR